MKLFRNTAAAVIEALQEIFIENRYADKVIEKTLKQNPRWGARDRRFIAETTYDIVRWYRFLREVSGAKDNDFWGLLGAWCHLNAIELPRWEEFNGVAFEGIDERIAQVNATRKVRESVPDWLDELGERELGKQWEKELSALNEEARVVLRTNTLKISRKELQQVLADQGAGTEALIDYPDALALEQRQNVFQLPAFKDGLFELQDAGSQLISPFLQPRPGMRVVDACAGGGGKTLHLAALMHNKGRILALDTEAWKLDELKKRARRAGAANIETRVIESSKTIKRLDHSADLLLLDVPCSGIGVLKRNPDAKWKLNMDFIERVKVLQQQILEDYHSMLKSGGLMVYSTCSVLPSENEMQVKRFLDNAQGKFLLLEERKVLPSEGFDGFYMALVRKL